MGSMDNDKTLGKRREGEVSVIVRTPISKSVERVCEIVGGNVVSNVIEDSRGSSMDVVRRESSCPWLRTSRRCEACPSNSPPTDPEVLALAEFMNRTAHLAV